MFKKSAAPAAAASGYTIAKSLRFRASATAYLSRTPASQTNTTTWTWSAWVKRGRLTNENYLFGGTTDSYVNNWGLCSFNNTTNVLYVQGFNGGAQTYQAATNAVFRDPSAWYHFVIAFDTTQATDTNRIKLYVNGVLQTLISSGLAYPSQNLSTYINRACLQTVGGPGTYTHDGEMAEINFIDGQALTPTSFGSTNSTTGVWQPIAYTGTYGTNGFYLKFTDTTSTTTLCYDYSGNSNNWTPNNISLTAGATYDSMTDVPTLTSATAANYCVFNTIASDMSVGSITDAGLTISTYTGSAQKRGSFAVTSGKYYWEITVTGGVAATSGVIGITDPAKANNSSVFSTAGIIQYYGSGDKYVNGTGSAYGASYTTGAVIGVALDMTGSTITFYKNNASQGSISTSGTLTTAMPMLANGSGTDATNYTANFGQQPFTYTPPTGFVALNTYNLPTSTVPNGALYMAASLYTGTNAPQSITNSGGFKPDLVWAKDRTTAGTYNGLSDSVRGVNKALFSNTTDVESSAANNYVTAFNSNGFSVYQGGVFNGNVGDAYVGWQWQAGAGTSSSNTNGSITSTVSVNASAGFSIVSYTGNGSSAQTVGHGLGVAPSMIIVKNRNAESGGDPANYWCVWHKSVPTLAGYLNTTDNFANNNYAYYAFNNATAPTSSVFSVSRGGTYPSAMTNGSGNALIAYCWSEVAGFSAFGSYTGNGSTDGPFVYLGFRPKFVMVKLTTATDYWTIIDTTRNPYNSSVYRLYPNDSLAEDTLTTVDMLSNGFKVRSAGATSWNASGGTLIYAAFAENPFKNALAR